MQTFKLLFILIFCGMARITMAQEMPADMVAALKADDPSKLSAYVGAEKINSCYTDGSWDYSLLAQTIRFNAPKCFRLLIDKGADVNHVCEGYVPPLMHAAKYGRLDMVKVLVAKGADIHYKYSGDYEPADGETPLTYAEKNNQSAVADYLRSLK